MTILAIDQGTTSSRVIIFSDKGEEIKSAQKELTLYYPNKGWVEQDAKEIWSDVLACLRDVTANNTDISAIGITNQRETTILWNRKTGGPVYNAIVWQDRRTGELCQSLKQQGLESTISDKTGLLLDPYFSATKIKWILDNIPDARKLAERGELAFGTVDSWLLWNLTDGKSHKTDITNASRTMLFNIKTQEWDDELLKIFDIPKSILPEVCENIAEFGETDINGKLVVVRGMAGDQHAAMIGQCCFKPGMIKSTYGTGCFALMNIGKDFKPSKNRLLTTIAYKINGELAYAIEGSIFVAGAAVQWLRDNVNFFEHASESEKLALSVPDSNGVYFIPAFTGLGAPYWEPEARAAIFGLTRESNKAHITRAALEAQGFQTLDLMDAMEKDSGFKPEILRVDGGLTANGFVCQFISDILGCPVEVPKNLETTALGAAYLAGLGARVFKNMDSLTKQWKRDKCFEPIMEESQLIELYSAWKISVNALIK